MILNEIIQERRSQLARELEQVSREEMKARALRAAAPRDFAGALQKAGLGVVAEVKRASPSAGVIAEKFEPEALARAYERGGADAVSVLTEERYFMGSSQILQAVRRATKLPILRKDFIFDPYQIYEARALGADAVLLIAAALPEEKLRELAQLAGSLGLAALVEAHNAAELAAALRTGSGLVGINNRDLRTFDVNLQATRELAARVPSGVTLVSESGLRTREDLAAVRAWGADAALVGESLVRSGDPAAALRELRLGESGL